MILHPCLSDVEARYGVLDKAVHRGLQSSSAIEEYAWRTKENGLAIAKLASAIPTDANDDDLSIPFIITTLIEDRDGDVVVPLGCQLDNFAKNPVCFFGHQQNPYPIAKCKSPDGRITVFPEENLIRAVMYFDRDDPDAVKVYGKVKNGFLNATSIAFVPIDAVKRDPELEKGILDRSHPHSEPGRGPVGWIFKRYDLTEISVVGVPSNSGAVAIRDWLDTDKDLGDRLRKSMLPYAAKSLGRSFSGWCPPGHTCVKGTCVPTTVGKTFVQGDHVGITSGEYAGKTGVVYGNPVPQTSWIGTRPSKLGETTYRVQIDGFPKPGGWNGQVLIAESRLSKKSLEKGWPGRLSPSIPSREIMRRSEVASAASANAQRLLSLLDGMEFSEALASRVVGELRDGRYPWEVAGFDDVGQRQSVAELLSKSARTTVEKYITHAGSKWVVHAESGKVLGTHGTKADAERQLAAVEANKHKTVKPMTRKADCGCGKKACGCKEQSKSVKKGAAVGNYVQLNTGRFGTVVQAPDLNRAIKVKLKPGNRTVTVREHEYTVLQPEDVPDQFKSSRGDEVWIAREGGKFVVVDASSEDREELAMSGDFATQAEAEQAARREGFKVVKSKKTAKDFDASRIPPLDPAEIERAGFPLFVTDSDSRDALEQQFPAELAAWRREVAAHHRLTSINDKLRHRRALEQSWEALRRAYGKVKKSVRRKAAAKFKIGDMVFIEASGKTMYGKIEAVGQGSQTTTYSISLATGGHTTATEEQVHKSNKRSAAGKGIFSSLFGGGAKPIKTGDYVQSTVDGKTYVVGQGAGFKGEWYVTDPSGKKIILSEDSMKPLKGHGKQLRKSATVGQRVAVVDDGGVCQAIGKVEEIIGSHALVREDGGRADEWPVDMLDPDWQQYKGIRKQLLESSGTAGPIRRKGIEELVRNLRSMSPKEVMHVYDNAVGGGLDRTDQQISAIVEEYKRDPKGFWAPHLTKQLLESSGTTGGYTVATNQPLGLLSTPGEIVCQQCDGSGNCPACEGSGLQDDADCDACDGSGECSMCSGAGKTMKSIHKSVFEVSEDGGLVAVYRTRAEADAEVQRLRQEHPRSRQQVVETDEKPHQKPYMKSVRKGIGADVAAFYDRSGTMKPEEFDQKWPGLRVSFASAPKAEVDSAWKLMKLVGPSNRAKIVSMVEDRHGMSRRVGLIDRIPGTKRANDMAAKKKSVLKGDTVREEVAPNGTKIAIVRQPNGDLVVMEGTSPAGPSFKANSSGSMQRAQQYFLKVRDMNKKSLRKSRTRKSIEPIEGTADVVELDLENEGNPEELKGEDDPDAEPFTPKPSALEAAKAYQHLKDLSDYYGPGGDGDLEKMDHPGMQESLKELIDDHLPKAMEHVKSALTEHHGKGEDPDEMMDKCMKALGGADEFETGEAGMVDNGDVPPDDEVTAAYEEGDPEEKGWELCPMCDGTGNAGPDNTSVCGECGGSGHVQTEKSEVGSEEWAVEETDEPEHKDESDPDTEEIIERYQHPKSKRWQERVVGRARRAKNGRVYIVRRKDLSDPGNPAELTDGPGTPGGAIIKADEGQISTIKAAAEHLEDAAADEATPKMHKSAHSYHAKALKDVAGALGQPEEIKDVEPIGEPGAAVEMDLTDEGNPQELKTVKPKQLSPKLAGELAALKKLTSRLFAGRN